METVRILPLNETYVKIEASPGVYMELRDRFSYEVAHAKFLRQKARRDPRFRKYQNWDGQIRLFKIRNHTIYKGLVGKVKEFCKERGYQIEDRTNFDSEDRLSVAEAEAFMNSLSPHMDMRDYQAEALSHCVRRRRTVLVSPTASGKSFLIYSIIRYFNKRTLLIIPTTGLAPQMTKEFHAYSKKDPGWHVKDHISWIMEGYSKDDLKDVTISTWQSIYEMPVSWFEQFEVVIVDEAHLAKADSLVAIMEKLKKCQYRFGTTGTLDGVEIHELVLEGLFGPSRKIISTSKLIDDHRHPVPSPRLPRRCT